MSTSKNPKAQRVMVNDQPCMAICLGVPVTKKYRWHFINRVADALANKLSDEQVQTIAKAMEDESTDKKWNIIRAILAVQPDDATNQFYVPQLVWTQLKPKERGEFSRYTRTCADQAVQEKENARMCLDFLDQVRDEVAGGADVTHYRSGTWGNEYHLSYRIPAGDESQLAEAQRKMGVLSDYLNYTVPDKAGAKEKRSSAKPLFDSHIDVLNTGDNKAVLLGIGVSDEALVGLLKDKNQHAKLLHALTHPEQPELPTIQRIVMQAREEIDAGKPQPTRCWAGGGVKQDPLKEIRRAGRGGDNRADSASFELH